MKRNLRILQIAVCMILYNFTVTAFSWCFKLITDSLTMKQFELFHRYIWLAVFIVVIQAISNYFYIKGKNTYVTNTMIKLKSNFVKAVFNYEINRFQQKDITEYQSFLFNDLSTYEQKVITGKIDICEKIILLLFSGMAIILINPSFLILIAFLFVFSLGVPVLFGKYAKKFNTIFSESCSKATDKFVEMMSGFTILRTFSIERKGITECNEAISNMEAAKNDYKSAMAVFQSLLMFMTTILTLTIFAWGGKAVISDTITVGELIALVQLLFNIASPLMGIMTSVSNVKAAQPLSDKYKEYVNVEKQVSIGEFTLENSIKLEDISFSYPEDIKPTLSHINHKFEKNKKYAIVGENGSGKSTLLKLIAGVIDMNGYQGKILMDHMERKELQEETFWKHVSYIPQQVFLFKKRLIENIYLNQVIQKDDDFKVLVEKLDIDKLLRKENAVDGVEYMELSGGERQKIAFIRGILKTSWVVLADEPDAALDPEAGAVIHEVLLELKKTCIVVTHQINGNLARYDEILVMENGEIIECGTYNELMELKGWLYQMSLNIL